MSLNYIGTTIDESPVRVAKANAAITDVRGKAICINADGKCSLADTAGEIVNGIALMTSGDDETGAIAAGQGVDFQIKDCGMAKAGGAFGYGAELTTDANGLLVKATTAGQFVIATALTSASASGDLVKVEITKYYKAADVNSTAVSTAKGLIEGGSYSYANATANTEAAIKAALPATINALTGMSATGITITEDDITMTDFTAAVAGTSAGSFKFTCNVTKGSASDTTSEETGTITQ